MTKTYITDKYSIEVKECDVVRETEKQIWYMAPHWDGKSFREERRNKQSEYYCHHASMAEALQFLIEREVEKAEYHRKKEIEHSQNASKLIARLA